MDFWNLCICFCFVNRFIYIILKIRFYYKWYHVIFVFVWLSSLSMTISRPIHVVANGIISFFSWLSSIPLNICATTSLSSPLPMDILVAFMFWLLWIMLLWTLGCMCLFKLRFSLAICPEVGLLDHIVVLYLLFWRTSILFSIVVHQPTFSPMV